ncbi:MAG: hypothetical protein M1823_003769 [Watsoniomyces obsoletus]|nr:MAG: hypothetical protein M1823_003769 [Watsoniomyces obsoletus]
MDQRAVDTRSTRRQVEKKRATNLQDLPDDIWYLIVEQLSDVGGGKRKEAHATLLNLRRVSRRMNTLATSAAFQRVKLHTNAVESPKTNQFLEYLLSEPGERLRRSIREINVVEWIVQDDRFKGHLLEELVQSVDRLSVFRWNKHMFMPAPLLMAIERQWPGCQLHLTHMEVPEPYQQMLPPPGSMQFLRCLHALHLDLNVNVRARSRYFSHLLRKTIRFPNLRILEICFRHAHRPSSWWGLLPRNVVLPPRPRAPILALHVLVLRGMTHRQLDGVQWNDNNLYDWTQLRRLEVTHPPRRLLIDLRGRLPHLRSFATGPFFGQVDSDRQTQDDIWSPQHWHFINALPPLERLSFVLCGGHLGVALDEAALAVLRRHAPTLRALRLYTLVISGVWDSQVTLSAEALQEINRCCPHLESFEVNIDRNVGWDYDVIRALAAFPRLQSLELLAPCDIQGLGQYDRPQVASHSAESLVRKICRHQTGVRLKNFALRFGIWHWGVQRLLDQQTDDENYFWSYPDRCGRLEMFGDKYHRTQWERRELRQIARTDKREARRERWHWGWRATLLGTLGMPLPTIEH